MLEVAVLRAESVTAVTTNEAHPHGMTNGPDVVVTTLPSHVDVTVGTTPPTMTDIFLTNVNAGNQVCEVLMIAL